MSNATWAAQVNEGQYSQLNTGAAYASSVTLTDVSPGGNTAGQALTFPASYMQAGMQFRINANGIVSTTGAPTLLLGLYWGGVAGTAIASTGAQTALTSITNTPWVLDALLRVEATGTSGSIRTIASILGPYATTVISTFPSSSSGNNVTIDTSTAKILTIGAQWGTNSASNSLQVMQFSVLRLNEGSS